MLKKALAVAALCALGATAVMAQDVIAQRKDLMKGNWGAAGPLVRVLRGQAQFNLEQAQTGMQRIADGAMRAQQLFPENSKDGPTAALPAIWQNKQEFDALFAKLAQDARAAQAAIKDEASLRAELPKVMQTCDACHNKYQKPAS
jgi:cytochrome c556